MTPRDTTARDTTARDTTARDTTARDTTARDTAARDTTARDTTARDTTARDTTPATPAPPRIPLIEGTAAARTPRRSTRLVADEPTESTLRTLRFEATAGAGINAPTPATISALLSADAALRLSPWRFGLLAAFSFGGSTPVLDDVTGRERGTLTARSLFFLPHAMLCLDRTVSVCGGLRAGLRIAIGSAAGQYIFQTQTVLAPTPTTGLGGRVAFGVGPLLFALDLSLLVNLATPKLAVTGLKTTIETPRFDLLLSLSAGGRSR